MGKDLDQIPKNDSIRLTLDNQPSKEGKYSDIGEAHRED
ncbi:uncharacterized protein METZ01_LOCUS248235, partial [marine metagenome]